MLEIIITLSVLFFLLLLLVVGGFLLAIYMIQGGFQKQQVSNDFIPIPEMDPSMIATAIHKKTGDDRFTQPTEFNLPLNKTAEVVEEFETDGGEYV